MWNTTCTLLVSTAVVKWWYTGLWGLPLHAENMAVMWWAAESTSTSAPGLGWRTNEESSVKGKRHFYSPNYNQSLWFMKQNIHCLQGRLTIFSLFQTQSMTQRLVSRLLWIVCVKYAWTWSGQSIISGAEGILLTSGSGRTQWEKRRQTTAWENQDSKPVLTSLVSTLRITNVSGIGNMYTVAQLHSTSHWKCRLTEETFPRHVKRD